MKRVIYLILLLPIFLSAQNKINQNIFGFRSSTAFVFFDTDDSIFVNLIDSISPNILSFPGGLGNFYHLDGPGYGLLPNEIAKYHTGNKSNIANTFNRIGNKKGHDQNYIYDFIALVKKTDARVIYNANILTADTQEVIKILDLFSENNIEIIGVELGGELSNRTYKHILNEEIYIEKATLFANNIKKYYPKINIIAVAAPVHSLRRHHQWNLRLSKNNFYDAVVTHSYAKVTKGKDQFGRMINEEKEGDDQHVVFDKYKKRALNYLLNDYPREIKKIREIYNKPIWVTEWNLQMSKITANTMLQALFVVNYLMELCVNQTLRNIELATFHNLAGRTISGSMILKKDNNIKLMASYFGMNMISEFFSESDFYVEKDEISKECFKYTFVSKTKEMACFINWSNATIKHSIKPHKVIEVKEYASENLFDTNEMMDYTRSKVNDITDIFLSPHSITVIKKDES